jgi:hypothetical protein
VSPTRPRRPPRSDGKRVTLTDYLQNRVAGTAGHSRGRLMFARHRRGALRAARIVDAILASVRWIAKPTLWLAALVSATTLLIQFTPGAYRAVWDPQHDAKQSVRSLHAGYDKARFIELLGQPSIVRAIDESAGLLLYVWTEDRYYIQTIVEQRTGESLLYSVMSCSPAFAPSFSTPIGTDVRLQSVPLAEAESLPETIQKPEGLDRQELNHRQQMYYPGVTVSSPDVLIETSTYPDSNLTRNRSFFVGISGACQSPTSLRSDYPAPHGTRSNSEFRKWSAANFYCEIVDIQVDFRPEYFGAALVTDPAQSGKKAKAIISLTPDVLLLARPSSAETRTATFGD